MKKAFAVMLLLVLVAFAACGRNKDNDDADEVTGVIDLGGGRIHAARDFGGRTLTIGAWWAEPIGAIAWGDEPQRTGEDAATNYPIARMMWDNARRVEEVFNVRFDYRVVGYDEFLDVLTASVLGGDPIADVVYLSGWMQMEAMGTIIQPWNSVDLPRSDILHTNMYGGATTQDDQFIWAINQHSVMADAVGLAVNLDIINADGLPNPIELFEAGEWTWEAMLDLMRRATRDTTGGGVINQFGIGGQPGEIIQHLIGANDGVLVDANRNYGFDHPNTLATLEFAQIIFGERLWYAEAGGVMDTANWNRNFYAPYEDGVALLFPAVTWSLDNQPPEFNVGFVPFPMGPNNTTGNTWLRGVEQGICISVGTSWSVEDILIIFDELYSWPEDEPELLFQAGQLDWMREVFGNAGATEADVQRAIYAGVTAASDIGRSITPYYWVLGDFANAFWDREMDVGEAVEYHRQPRQDMLDQRFR
jgi:multiple sugar transport system substrate-binding protein